MINNPFYFATLFGSFVSLISLPLYTRLMSEKEFALYAEFYSLAIILTLICKFGIHQSLLIKFNATKSVEKIENIYNQAFNFTLRMYCISIVILLCLFYYKKLDYIYLSIIIYLIFDTIFCIQLVYLRYTQKGKIYLIANLMFIFTTHSCGIVGIYLTSNFHYRVFALLLGVILTVIYVYCS